jgi:cytochrome c biogenesis protein CcmG, thiol:disulfide interchange protein DsbE
MEPGDSVPMTEPVQPLLDPPHRPLWRRILTPWNVVTLLVLVWVGPRLLPHVGAVVGVGSGEGRVPAYAVVTLDGETITAESLRGEVVLVNVWATWCGPCRVEMPLLQAMHERHGDRGFTLLGLSVDRTGPEGVRTFLEERGITYPVAIVGSDVERAFGGVRGYPTSFLLDRQGVVRHAVIGPLAAATLELAVRRLLAEPL